MKESFIEKKIEELEQIFKPFSKLSTGQILYEPTFYKLNSFLKSTLQEQEERHQAELREIVKLLEDKSKNLIDDFAGDPSKWKISVINYNSGLDTAKDLVSKYIK